MSQQNRFWKILPPSDSRAFVSPNVAFSTSTTLAHFVANAAEGQMAIMDIATRNLVTGTGDPVETLVSGKKYALVQKRDGNIEQSVEFSTESLIVKQTYVAPVKEVRTYNAAGLTVAVGDELEVLIIDKTTSFMPHPTRSYTHICKSATLNTEIGLLRTMINSKQHPQNQNGEDLVVVTGSNAELIFTAKYFGQPFEVILRGKWAGAKPTLTTRMNYGSGHALQVGAYELASDIAKGNTHAHHNARVGTAQPSDFGLATKFTNPALNYNTYHIRSVRTEVSPTPKQKHEIASSFYIFVPTSGTVPTTALEAALGI